MTTGRCSSGQRPVAVFASQTLAMQMLVCDDLLPIAVGIFGTIDKGKSVVRRRRKAMELIFVSPPGYRNGHAAAMLRA